MSQKVNDNNGDKAGEKKIAIGFTRWEWTWLATALSRLWDNTNDSYIKNHISPIKTKILETLLTIPVSPDEKMRGEARLNEIMTKVLGFQMEEHRN